MSNMVTSCYFNLLFTMQISGIVMCKYFHTFIMLTFTQGVCPQTVTVLQQAWSECIKPCLILNKCDRLITEMKFSPDEAYVHLQRLLEQINSKVGELHSSTVMEREHQEVWSCKLHHVYDFSVLL